MKDNSYVFPSRKRKGYFIGLQKIWERIRESAEPPDVRLHDLRNSLPAQEQVRVWDSLLSEKSSATLIPRRQRAMLIWRPTLWFKQPIGSRRS